MSSRSVAVVVVLLALGCAVPAAEAPPPDLAVVRSQIDSVWARYSAAAVAGNADGIADLYVDSAYVVETGLATIRGKTALRSVAKDILAGIRIHESTIRPELTELAGDRALQFGEYRDVIQPKGQARQVVFGRFGAVLQRDTSGSWRVSRLMAVADSTK